MDLALGWIKSFLSGRKMCVSVGGCSSRMVDVTSGVPQGSVLGPVLFLVYVNSLADNLESNWYSFADDYKLYVSLPRKGHFDRVGMLQRDLDRIFTVAESWNLKLNPRKCVVMRFGGSGVMGEDYPVASGYFLGDTEIERVLKHKDLGVVVDRSLKFHLHTDVTARKASGMANNLLRSTVCREMAFMVALFISHVRPLLDYCSPVWNLGYVADVKKLENVQRRWTKQIAGFEELDYGARLRRAGLYSIAGRRLRSDLVKVWKIFHGLCSAELESLVDRQTHRATRGHDYKLAVPRCRTELRRRSFGVRVVRTWNGLSADVVSADTLHVFKRLLGESCSDLFFGVEM